MWYKLRCEVCGFSFMTGEIPVISGQTSAKSVYLRKALSGKVFNKGKTCLELEMFGRYKPQRRN